jgi:predicted  nucleic acid-binding Zn ribbon protein
MHTISIKYGKDIDENELWHAFYGLLGYLRHSGQLNGRYIQPYSKDGRISATIFTVTEEALDEKYHNQYVVKAIADLEKLCGNSLEIKHVGFGENEQNEICHCQKHDYFVLSYQKEFSPIICGSCDKSVPIFRMPKLHDFGYWTLTCWQSAFMACVMLDLNCGTGEKWAIRQQCDYDSGLSKQGREVAAKITETTGVKTYYFLANYSKRSRKQDIARPCPSCGGEWHLEQPIHHYFRHKCDKCLLMSAYSNHHR